jgi:hypothetical protein
MAKKKVQKKKAAKPVKRVRKTEAEHLQHLINVSKNAITGQGTGIDEFFGQQAARLEKQLEQLKAKGKNE